MKQKSINSGTPMRSFGISAPRNDFFRGIPCKGKSQVKENPRKYPVDGGYVTIREAMEMTGYNRNKLFKLLKYKTMNEILKQDEECTS
jgi:hypothetical protein